MYGIVTRSAEVQIQNKNLQENIKHFETSKTFVIMIYDIRADSRSEILNNIILAENAMAPMGMATGRVIHLQMAMGETRTKCKGKCTVSVSD